MMYLCDGHWNYPESYSDSTPKYDVSQRNV